MWKKQNNHWLILTLHKNHDNPYKKEHFALLHAETHKHNVNTVISGQKILIKGS